MRGKETLWKQIRTLWTVLLMAVLFVGAVQVKAGGNPEEGTTQGEVQAPTITITPYIDGEEYTYDIPPLKIGTQHILSVQATASDGSSLSYQWYDDDGQKVGSNSESLQVTKGVGREYYDVYVTTANGGGQWYTFWLHPEETLTVTQWVGNEQRNYAACQIGESVTFRVQAESSYEGHVLTYQWKDGNGNNIETANGEEYTITKEKIGEEYYACEVSDGNYTGYYTFSVDSGETLTINQLWINNQEYHQGNYFACTEEGRYTLKVEAETSLDKIEYQWYEENEGGADEPIAEATSPEITVDRPMGSKYYYCQMFDGNRRESVYFYLDLGDTLTIKRMTINGQEYEQGDYFACTEDEPYTLKVEAATSMDKIEYQWYEGTEGGAGEPIAEATSPEIIVDRPTRSKYYYCQMFDGNRSETAYFYLDLGDTLTIKQFVDGHPYNGYSTLECEAGEEFPLEVQAETTTENTLAYEWYYYDSDWTYHDIEEESNVCQVLMEAGERTYTCTVYDGNKRESVQFRLKTPNTLSVSQYINGKKESSGYFKNNDEIKLEVKAESSSGRDITYQWYQSGWDDENAILSGEKSSIYETTKNATTGDVYCCKVTDGLFTKRCVFYIDSEYTLSVTGYLNDGEYDSGYRFSQGEKITLRVEATSSENNDVEYEWYQEVDGDLTKLQTDIENMLELTKGKGTEYYQCKISDGSSQTTYYFELYEDVEQTELTSIPYINGIRYDTDYVSKYDCVKGQTLTLRAEVLSDLGADSISRVWEIYDNLSGEWTVLEGKTGESIDVTLDKDYTEYRCVITGENATDILYYDLIVQSEEEQPDEGDKVELIPYINGENTSWTEGKVGDVVKLSVEAVNAPENVTYQWFRSDEDGQVALRGETDSIYEYTIRENVYSLSCEMYADGEMLCDISFDIDAIAGEQVESTLTATKYINGNETSYLEYKYGDKVTLSIKADTTTGNSISYVWYDENDEKLGEGYSYTFEPTGYQEVYCIVSDEVTDKKLWFELEEKYTWFIKQYIDGEETEEKICANNTEVKLEVRPEGEANGSLTYKWFNNRNKLQGEGTMLTVIKTSASEMYRCEISDGRRTEYCWFYLQPDTSIVLDITQYIGGQETDEATLAAGAVSELKVDVSGTTDGITYQWYVSKDESAFRPLGTSAVQRVIGDNSYAVYLCVVRVGTIEEKVYFYTYYEGDAGEHVHVWNDGVITKEPTQTETGIKTYTCLTCGETKEEILDKLPPTTEDIKPSNPTTGTKPSTQPSQQTPSAQQPQTPSASASSPAPAIGATLVASDKKTVYKVTGSNTVEYKKAGANKAKVTIPSTVTYQGRKYQVTSIGTKAFKNNKKLKKVVIPSTVRKIGKQAFINCKKLKSITIKTNKLNAKAIGSKAFKGINAKATIKVPKKKLKLYKKILRAKGVSASVRIK